jgi:hypothetical protein
VKVLPARRAHKASFGITFVSFKNKGTSRRQRQKIVVFHLKRIIRRTLNSGSIPSARYLFSHHLICVLCNLVPGAPCFRALRRLRDFYSPFFHAPWSTTQVSGHGFSRAIRCLKRIPSLRRRPGVPDTRDFRVWGGDSRAAAPRKPALGFLGRNAAKRAQKSSNDTASISRPSQHNTFQP